MTRPFACAFALAISLVTASAATAQFTPVVPGSSCDSVGATGECTVWRVSPSTIGLYANALAGKRVRFTGVIVARCADQSLYFSEEAARHGWRELALQLFNAVPAELNAIDSLSVVEVEGVFVGPYASGTRRFAGALEEVIVLGRHGRAAGGPASPPTPSTTEPTP